MKKLINSQERMFQEFFGAAYFYHERYGDTELATHLQNSFNFSYRFPSDKKHKVIFGDHEMVIENEYFKMHYKNLDPRREFYMTPQTELLLVEVELYRPLPILELRLEQ